MAAVADPVTGMAGELAPPRRNGELVFQAPWESRAFGMAVALHERGLFGWEQFQQRLVAEIAAWETAHAGAEGWSYYERWLSALESLLAGQGLVAGVEVGQLTEHLVRHTADQRHAPH